MSQSIVDTKLLQSKPKLSYCPGNGNNRSGQVSRPVTKVRYPTPRSLLSVDGARHELARLYVEGKRGLHDPQILGRLAHVLSVLIGSAKANVFEARLDRLESRLDQADGDPAMPPPDGAYRQRLQ